MNWTDEALDKLNELIKIKFTELRESILLPADIKEQTRVIERSWHNYCMNVGIKMNIIPDYETETREDLPPPGGAMFLSNDTIRVRNIWGDKYVDISEQLAFKFLVLNGLP